MPSTSTAALLLPLPLLLLLLLIAASAPAARAEEIITVSAASSEDAASSHATAHSAEHAWSFGTAAPERPNPLKYDADSLARRPWAWRSTKSHYYNLGHTIAHRVCAQAGLNATTKAKCAALISPPHTPSRFLASKCAVLVMYGRAHDTHGSAGPFGLHSFVNVVNKLGGSAFMLTVSPIWDHFPKKIPQWSPKTPDQFVQQYGTNALVLVPDGIERVTGEDTVSIRVLRWMLGWHHSVYRNSRILAHTHYLAKVAGGSSSLLWNHGPPTMFLDHFKARRVGAGGDRVKASRVDYSKKRNLVLLDYDSHISKDAIREGVRRRVPDAEVIELAGFTPDRVKELYAETKVVVDNDMPGAEMINVEGLLFGALPVLGNNLVGAATMDYQSLPPSLRVDPHSPEQMVDTIADALLNYDRHRPTIEALREQVLTMDVRFERDVGIALMGHGLLFYTAASNNDEMRAVIPWILSVASAFPLARVEVVVTEQEVFERELEAALLVIRSLNQGVLSRQYVTIRPTGSRSVGSGNVFLVPPVTTGHEYTVFMDVRALMLGRDAVNAHDQLMRRHDLAAVGDPARSPFVMARSSLYWPALERVGELIRSQDADFQRNMDPALRSFVDDPRRRFRGAGPAVDAILSLSQLPKLAAQPELMSGIPLDMLVVADGGYTLHLTHDWAIRVDLEAGLTDTVRSVIEALDALVRTPIWSSASVFFPTSYQWLSYPHVALEFGQASLMEY